MSETTFANTPRIKNSPFSKRVGDDLLERDSDGGVSQLFGYFTPLGVALREKWSLDVETYLRPGLLFPNEVTE